MSHLTQVRGLKSHYTFQEQLGFRRTLHRCVDWNIDIIRVINSHSSRTLHRCVDWNDTILFSVKKTNVAPYTGAWIEIFILCSYCTICYCRTLHRCVDWNDNCSQMFVGAITSHLTQVRGLKCYNHSYSQGVSSRTLHRCVDWNVIITTYFEFNYCRTLHRCVDWNNNGSGVNHIGIVVAPYTGAWIEITQRVFRRFTFSVAPYTGAWIEMPLNGCLSVWLVSHLTQVRGLKYQRR